MTTVDRILQRARGAGERLTQVEGSALFVAAIRLFVEQGAAPRPQQLKLDEAGNLSLDREDVGPMRPEYLAPELAGDEPPRRSEPRVQVYAAGALGYELLTAQEAPLPPAVPGPELTGPLADLVRLALTADRRERFGDLQQLLDAVEVVQPRRSPESERQLFAALVRRSHAWGTTPAPKADAPKADASKELLRELSVRIDVLEASLQTLRGQHETVLKKLAEAARQVGARRKTDPPAAGPHGDGPHQLGGPALDPAEEWEAASARAGSSASLGKVFAVALLAALLVAGVAGAALWTQREAIFAVPAQRAQAAVQRSAAPPAKVDDSAIAASAHPAAGAPDGGALVARLPPASPRSPAADVGAAPTHSAAPPDEEAAPAAPADEQGTSGKPAAAGAGATDTPSAGAANGSPNVLALAIARSQVTRGDKALEAGNAAEAIASFRAALDNQPNLPEALRGLGMAHALQGKDKEARADYELYLKAAPQAADAADIRKAIQQLKSRARLGGDDK